MVTLAPNPDEAAEAAARRAAMRQRIAAASAQAEIDPAQHAPLLDIADEALAAKMPDLACWAWALAGSTLGRAGHYSSAQDLLNRCVSRARRERLRNWLLLAELYRAHVWYQQGLHDRSLAALLRLAQPHRLQQLELIQRLDGEHFWQVHRSTIVNAHAIKSVSRALSGKLSITLKSRPESLEVSPAYSHRFKQL